MQRRALIQGLRLLTKELGAETSVGVRSIASLGVTSPPIGASLRRALSDGSPSAAVVLLNPDGKRWSSSDTYEPSVFYPEPEVEVGSPAPDFSAQAVVDGEIKTVSLADYKGKYVVLFWYPKDFTFVCPTEIIAFSDRAKEFEKLNCQLIAASTDTPEVHQAWIRTPRKRGGLGYMQIPILADVTKEIAARYGVLKRDAGIALRGTYLINPEGIVEHVTINNFPVGRSVDETLRTLQAVQFVAEHGEVCPAGWHPGDKTMVADADRALDYFETVAEAGEAEAAPSLLTPVTSRHDYSRVVASGRVAVKFWAPWCGKCKQLAPFVEELQAAQPGVTIASFDTTDEAIESLAQELGVKGLPQIRFFKDGKEVLKPIMGYKKQPLQEAMQQLASM